MKKFLLLTFLSPVLFLACDRTGEQPGKQEREFSYVTKFAHDGGETFDELLQGCLDSLEIDDEDLSFTVTAADSLEADEKATVDFINLNYVIDGGRDYIESRMARVFGNDTVRMSVSLCREETVLLTDEYEYSAQVVREPKSVSIVTIEGPDVFFSSQGGDGEREFMRMDYLQDGRIASVQRTDCGLTTQYEYLQDTVYAVMTSSYGGASETYFQMQDGRAVNSNIQRTMRYADLSYDGQGHFTALARVDGQNISFQWEDGRLLSASYSWPSYPEDWKTVTAEYDADAEAAVMPNMDLGMLLLEGAGLGVTASGFYIELVGMTGAASCAVPCGLKVENEDGVKEYDVETVLDADGAPVEIRIGSQDSDDVVLRITYR